jgi:hypothetical protein
MGVSFDRWKASAKEEPLALLNIDSVWVETIPLKF